MLARQVAGGLDGQTGRPDQADDAIADSRPAQPALLRQPDGEDHPHRHGLAVQKPLVVGRAFDGVAQGVAEVQNRAIVAFGLVLLHDQRLELAARLDNRGQQPRFLTEQGWKLIFEQAEEFRAQDHPVLDDLGYAGQELAPRQGLECLHVDDHQPRLIECADQILSGWMVDRGLSAHAGIDLGEQAGRDLDERHPAAERGRGEAGQVADHSAAQREERRVPLQAFVHQLVVQEGEPRQVLVLLAGGNLDHHRLEPRGPQPADDRLPIMGADVGVGDHADPARGKLLALQEGPQIAQNPRSDVDGIGAGPQADAERIHRCRSIDENPCLPRRSARVRLPRRVSDPTSRS